MNETIRVNHSKNYTCISNVAIRDTRLSLKARGLHHLLLSYPNGWYVNIKHLVGESEKDGKAAINSALQELKKWGYLVKSQVRDSLGKITGWENIINEFPAELTPDFTPQLAGNQSVKSPEPLELRSEVAENQQGKKSRKPKKAENQSVKTPKPLKLRSEVAENQSLHSESDFPESSNPESGKSDHIINNDSNNYQNNKVSTLSPTPLKEESERQQSCQIPEEVKPQFTASLNDKAAKLPTNTITVEGNLPAPRDPFFYKQHNPSPVVWDWLPNGPWRTEEGKLDAQFQTAIASRWLKEHGGDLHEKKANVLKHFRNDPTNLPIEWEWYQSTVLHHAINIQTRKLAGMDTTTDEQEILKYQSAAAPIPEEMRVSATSAQQVLETSTYSNRNYHYGKAEPETSTEELDKARAFINELKKKNADAKKAKSKLTAMTEIIAPPEEDFYRKLEDMRIYLHCGDVLRQQAIDWASDPKNGCVLIKENGRVIDIEEMEF